MKEALPDLKFIVLLRDQVRKTYSHYQHEKRKGREERSFLEAIEEEKDVNAKADWHSDSWSEESGNRRHSYLRRGHYADLLCRWFSYFDPSQFMVIESERFSNPHR